MFNPEKHWNIERWWSKEEQIELGIVEEGKTTKFEELPGLIEEVANNLLSFKEEILQLNEKKNSKTKFKNYKIKDLFDIKSGNSKITQKYLNEHTGDYVVYSANTKQNGIFGYINFFDFDTECIQITTNGVYAGTVFYRKKHKFSINGDARLLIKKYENLDYLYLLKTLQDTFAEHNFNWENKPTVNKIKDIVIKIPIDSNGNFDLNTQREIAGKFSCVSELKTKIESYKKQIEELNIEVSEDYQYKEVLLNNIFDFPSIKGLTATFIQKNGGNIPVYGGRKEGNPIGYIADNLPNVKYFENCLGWNREGSVGYVFWHNHKFTTNDHHRPLLLKENLKNSIDVDYIKFTLQKILLSMGFRWSKTASKDKVEKLQIKVPVLKNGEFDLQVQKEIAEKYRKIEQIKKSISEELDKIAKTNVEF